MTATSEPAPASTTLPTTTVASRTPISGYFIGNSLTWDTLGAKPNNFLGLDILARQADFKIQPNGYHILCGSSLTDIRTHPAETCVDPDPATGNLAQAFPSSTWDFVTAQPYPGPDSTLLTDEEMIAEIMDATSDATRIFILTGWPPSANFDETWTAAVENVDTAPTQLSRQYFEHLRERLARRRPVSIIPVGEVLFELDKKLRSGDVPGYRTASDLYRDDIHLNDAGRWVASVTAAAVILDVDPTTFGKPRPPWYGDGTGFSAAFIDTSRQVVSEVLDSSDR